MMAKGPGPRAAAVVLSLSLSAPALAHGPGGHGAPSAPRSGGDASSAARSVPLRLDESEQRRYFTDLALVTQDGREVRFYTDLLKGRIVLISFFYTNCTDVCPILMPNLGEVQRLLGDRFGRDVFFVSISVDPEDDTPEAIKEYAERFGARPGWTLLTGKREHIDRIVDRLGQQAADFEDHSLLFLLGDVRNARWRKVRGDSPPELVAAALLDLLERK